MLINPLPDPMAIRFTVNVHAGERQERLVDRIDLHLRREFLENFHDPIRHIPVKREVRGKNMDTVRHNQFLPLKKWLCHFDPQGFGLLTASDGTTIVIRQNHNRLAAQSWIKDPLAGRVEIITIDQRDDLAVLR